MSNFKYDLKKEQILAQYLDDVYADLHWQTMRTSDSENQNKGIDLLVYHDNKPYSADEKAQLSYINQELPTFAFELSYLKDNTLKKGWLFDEKKETDYYFLVTNIFLKNKTLESKTDIKSVKVTSVNRKKLLTHLNSKGINRQSIEYETHDIREQKAFGKHVINGLNSRTEGNIYFTKALSEQPINLVLKLDYLIRMKVAKIIYP